MLEQKSCLNLPPSVVQAKLGRAVGFMT